MMLRSLAGSAAAVVGLSLTSAAFAEPAPAALPRVARLSYVLRPGATGCPEEQAFRASVRAQADRDLFPAEAAARVRVAVSRRLKDRRYEAVIDLHDEGGLRFHQEIDPLPRCSDVVETAVALLVNKLDPVHAEEKETPPAPPSSVAAPAAPPPPVVRTEDRLSFHAGLGSWLGLGVAPRPAAGMSGEVGIRWSPVSVSAELRWDPPASAEVGGAQLSTWRVVGALVPCGHWSRKSFGLFGCAVVQAGEITGTSEGVPGASSQGEPYVAAGGRLGMELRLASLTPHLGLRLSGDMLGKVKGAAFVIRDQVAWRTPPLAGDLGLGVIAFW